MPAKPAILAAISAPLFAVAALAAVAGAVATSPESTAPICTDPGKAPAAGDLTTEQLENARIIAQVGVNMGVPMAGETIAIATAMQAATATA